MDGSIAIPESVERLELRGDVSLVNVSGAKLQRLADPSVVGDDMSRRTDLAAPVVCVPAEQDSYRTQESNGDNPVAIRRCTPASLPP